MMLFALCILLNFWIESADADAENHIMWSRLKLYVSECSRGISRLEGYPDQTNIQAFVTNTIIYGHMNTTHDIILNYMFRAHAVLLK